MTEPVAVPTFVSARRSVRAFRDTPLEPRVLESLVTAACLAPAPHHTRPWRFAVIVKETAKHALGTAMGEAWRIDLTRDGVDAKRCTELIDNSNARITSAPALILGCLTSEGLDSYPDDVRRNAETALAMLSLGAAVENLMLAATDRGLASCWIAAPAFCPDAARSALDLPLHWTPQALVLVGHPDPDYTSRVRPSVDLDTLMTYR